MPLIYLLVLDGSLVQEAGLVLGCSCLFFNVVSEVSLSLRLLLARSIDGLNLDTSTLAQTTVG
jgi:hypothetical protein